MPCTKKCVRQSGRFLKSAVAGLALVAVFSVLAAFPPKAHALPVIPGGEGFGMETPAGSGPNRSGGAILHVTTLADSGPGSLREALEASGPRIVVFDVSGYISLQSEIRINNPYLTLAGQTAPSPGVTLKNAGLLVMTHDVLIQHIRIRVGDDPAGPSPDNRDGLGIIDNNNEGDVYNVVVDHVSVSWAIDENMSTWYDTVRDVTVSNSIISEGLWHSLHPDGPHSKGFLVGYGTHNLSVIGNLFAHNDERNMRVLGDTDTLFLNNLVYNWRGSGGAGVYGSDSGPLRATIVGNEYIKGLDTAPEGSSQPVTISSSIVTEGSKVFVEDNVAVETSGDPWSVVKNKTTDEIKATSPPVWLPNISVKSGSEIKNWVLANAGARRADAETVDERITQDVKNGTGWLIDSQDDVGGWPPLVQKVRGQNGVPLLSVPPGNIQPSGYTDVEEWLHQLAAEVSGFGAPEPEKEAELSIALTDSIDPMTVGQEVTYQITATNSGPDAATGVTLEYTLPAGATLKSAAGCSEADGVVTCALSNLSPGAQAVLNTIVLTANAVGTLNSEAMVFASEKDPSMGNNTAYQETQVVGNGPEPAIADLSITNSAIAKKVRVGSTVVYVLTVTNAGPKQATGIIVNSDLGSGVEFVSASAACTLGSTVLTCPLGSLPAGKSTTLNVSVQAMVSKSAIENTATVSADELDPNLWNNSATSRVTVSGGGNPHRFPNDGSSTQKIRK
ncbi:MAG: DUF11 domain-containing protein [Nitrospinaceae bacterium]|nr:MAG: DUF11 domain-containing protein [Nitrospinaceae bacterium]